MIDIFDLIAQVETGASFEAFRFEEDVFARISANRTDAQKVIISAIIEAHGGPSKCSWHTALSIYSSSYGAVQIMGFNLYGPVCCFKNSVLDFMRLATTNDPTTADSCQRVIFSHLLKAMALDKATPENLATSPALRKAFAVEYNGSENYAAGIVSALAHFGIPVTN